MCASARSVSIVDIGSINFKESMFEKLCNDKINFLENRRGCYCVNYPRLSAY